MILFTGVLSRVKLSVKLSKKKDYLNEIQRICLDRINQTAKICEKRSISSSHHME